MAKLERTDHPVTQAFVIEQLQNRYAVEWPALHGLVCSHREPCMAAALCALDHALSDPMATRKSVRRQMVAALCQIADWGPERAASGAIDIGAPAVILGAQTGACGVSRPIEEN